MPNLLHTLFRGWRAALPLVAVALLSPQRAAAGCGDHVTVLNPAAQPAHGAMPSPAGEPVPPSPCDGPGCSRAPQKPAPLSAPAGTTAPTAKELASFARFDPDTRAHSSFDRDTASERPVRRSSSIFHPPRAV